MNRKLLAPLFIALLCGLFSCSQPSEVAGTGSETGNARALVGKLVKENGSSAEGMVVYLRPDDFLAQTSAKRIAVSSLKTIDTATTNSEGNYTFGNIAAGIYVLECLDGEPGNGVLIDSVVVDNADSVTEADTDTLKPLGSIEGQIPIRTGKDASQIRVLLFGLDRVAVPDSFGRFSISGLPEGRYKFRIVEPDTFWDIKGESAAQVTAGDTTNYQVSLPIRSFYVSPAGSDTASGTMARPFRTIQQGLKALGSGDTLNIRGGAYSEPGFSTPNIHRIPDGKPDSFTVVRGYPGEAATITPFFDGAGCGLNFESGKYISIENLILKGPGAGSDWPGVRFADSVSYIRLVNLEISNFGGSGVFAREGARHIEMIRCDLHHLGNMLDKGAGMVFGGDSSLFDGNHFHHNTQQGAELFGSGSCDYNIVRNNRIDSNGIGNQGTGLVIDGNYNLVYNNVICRNRMAGIDIGYNPSSSYNQIFNNTIALNSGAGIFVGIWTLDTNDAIYNHLANNILHRNGVDLVDTLSQHNTILENNLMSDPLFVDTANGDFRLQAASSAIDAGVDLSANGVLNDVLGNARPQGSAFDIGAYEFVPGPPTNKIRHPLR